MNLHSLPSPRILAAIITDFIGLKKRKFKSEILGRFLIKDREQERVIFNQGLVDPEK